MKLLRKREEQKESRFGEFVEILRTKFDRHGTGYLFGSRARGEASYVSDFDVLCIGDVSQDRTSLRLWASEYSVDLFVIARSLLDKELEDMNTLLLDALTEGRVLFDDLGIHQDIKKRVESFARSRNIVRTPQGWYSRGMIND